MKRAFPLAACALAIAVAVSAGTASAARRDSIDVAITPSGPSSAAQGAPFAFTAHLTSSEGLSGTVVFTLTSPSGASVAFSDQLAILAPGIRADVSGSVIPSQWYREVGRYQLTASVGGQPVGKALTFDVTKATTVPPTFANVTAPLGLTTSLPPTACGRWSSGAAWGEANGDGLLDLYVPRGGSPAALFIQQSTHRFVDEAAARGVDLAGFPALGASFADYDNDGHPDLAVVGDGTAHLLRNDGTGHFTDVSATAGIGGAADYMGMSASWADYDGDGNLDLYVANHSRCAPTSSNRGAVVYNPDQLYHNNGNGTFTEVSSMFGTLPNGQPATIGAGFLGAWFDANGDMRPDLYLANDYLGSSPDRNHLWLNNGTGGFTDMSVNAGVSFGMNTMGVGLGDYDRNGTIDFAISNWGPNRLLHNNGDGTFTNVGVASRVEREFQQDARRGVTWGPEFGDFNNDGWEDLYIAAGYLVGYLTPEDTPQRNELFVNDQQGKFYDLSATSGADDPGQSRGVAMADFNKDGRLDLFVVNQGGEPHLFQNTTKLPKYTHWLEVNTVGTRSNRDGCGTKLSVRGVRVPMIREVYCGSTSVSSGSSKIVHFGFGVSKKMKTVALEITWPSGTKQVVRKIKVDQLITLTEPKV